MKSVSSQMYFQYIAAAILGSLVGGVVHSLLYESQAYLGFWIALAMPLPPILGVFILHIRAVKFWIFSLFILLPLLGMATVFHVFVPVICWQEGISYPLAFLFKATEPLVYSVHYGVYLCLALLVYLPCCGVKESRETGGCRSRPGKMERKPPVTGREPTSPPDPS